MSKVSVFLACVPVMLALSMPARAEPAPEGNNVSPTVMINAAPTPPPPAPEPAASPTATPAPAVGREPTEATRASADADGRTAADPKTDSKTVGQKLAPPPKPAPTLAISVDLSRQTLTVTDHGAARYTWAISSGRQGYETPGGAFRPQWMAKMWYSRKYDDAPMPNAIFFTGGFAIHGTASVSHLGRPASHGCVRLAPGNAAALFKLVQKEGMDRTRITVRGRPHFDEPAVASRDRSTGERRYASRERSVHYGRARGNDDWTSIFGTGSGSRRYVYPGDDAPRRRAYLRPAYGYGYGYGYGDRYR